MLSGGPASFPDDREVRREQDETLDRDRHTLLRATNYETEVYTIEAPNPSPTAFVVVGMHGNGRAGVEAAQEVNVRPYVAGSGRGDPSDVSPHTFRHSIAFRMIRREDQRLEDVMLRLRHSSIQTTDQIYGHLRRR